MHVLLDAALFHGTEKCQANTVDKDIQFTSPVFV